MSRYPILLPNGDVAECNLRPDRVLIIHTDNNGTLHLRDLGTTKNIASGKTYNDLWESAKKKRSNND